MNNILNFLQFLDKKSSQKQLVRIITQHKNIVLLITEILYNILHNNINVSPSLLQQLKRHRRLIYKIVDKRTSLVKRRRMLIKGWPIVHTLLPILPSILQYLTTLK